GYRWCGGELCPRFYCRGGRARPPGPPITRTVREGDGHQRKPGLNLPGSVYAELEGLATAAGVVVGRYHSDGGDGRRREYDAGSHRGGHCVFRHHILQRLPGLGEKCQVAKRQPKPCLAMEGRKNRSPGQLLLWDQKCGIAELWRGVLYDLR